MASPMNATWWSMFLTEQGRDSEEESAFLGYLTTQKIAPDSDPAILDEAYGAFHTWMLESGARASADPGPTREELLAQQAVEAFTVAVPQSRTSNPTVSKPLTAATHPDAQTVAAAQAVAARRGEEPPTPTPGAGQTTPTATTPPPEGEPATPDGRRRH
jgi:hypothetical protein